MAIYAITYDLNKDKNYQKLWDEFKKLDACKAARSFYLVNLNNSTSDVIAHFQGFIDKDDILIVVKTTIHDIKTYRPLKGTGAWIKENS
mgnify:CR=1 FL=1